MKLTNHEWLRACGWLGLLSIVMGLTGMGLESAAHGQAVSTTTVQGTVYLANGQPGTGTLVLSWPSFTTASGQLVVADSTTVTIAPDGFVSVNLAPNLGATPAGQFYTAVYYLSDGTTSTEYWVVPVGAQVTLGQVQAQLMPAAQAVQAVSKAYVDQAISALAGGVLTVTGATMTGPLTLCCDPTQPLQAADKHYVDENIALEVPLAGGSMTGPLTSVKIGALYQVDQFSGGDFGAKLSACLSGLSQTQGGTCDARNFTGTLSMGSNLTISTANATVQLPCATISTAHQVIVTAGTRNVSLRGCALRGASTASGSQGGTVFLYSGTGAMVQVGDPTYAADTMGFHLDNAVINTTSAASATAQGFLAYRAQELDLESLYFLGNSNQTGMTLDGTGNYTGGTFYDDEFIGFQTAVNAIGHQISNPATTDWLNASTFVRLHIDCPTSGGNPIGGSYGINLQQGDGNTITGGDIEGCATALHLGANAQNNTIVGLRNENSTNQVVADAGSAYNNWMTGGTLFTGALTDNGTRNSFLDTFHRSFNGLNGDWYGSQKDATVTNHYRIGIGANNERGLLNRYQTDYGYRWTTGLTDATAGEQFYEILDELNNVYRISIGQYNNGQSSTNNQTVINSAGTGAVVLNGSNNSGTGGVVIGSGGASETTVATINNAGNAQFNGTLQVGGTSTFAGTPTVKNQADAEIDATLWAGLTASQKESFIYKDWNGNSQWYMVKDASNNWALNSATGGLDSFKAYQSTNSGDTYINASNASGVVRVNYETGSGTGFNIYGGGSSSLYASFTGTTAIKFPGLAASSGHNCLQIDNSGYITNTGAACGAGGSNGTVNAGTSGQIAYYSGTSTSISGTNTVSITAGGTGASSASGALANLGGASITGAAFTGPVSAPSVIASTVAAGATAPSGFAGGALNDLILITGPWIDPRAYGNDLQAACNAAIASGSGEVRINSTVTVSSTVVCGYVESGSQQIAPTIHIANGGQILCSMTNNTDCIDAFAVNCDGGAPGGVPGGAIPYASIFLTPTAVVRNVVGPVDQSGLQESIGVDNCTISANAGGGAIVTHAVVDLSETFNTSTFTNSTVEQWSSGTPGSYTPGVLISVVPGGVNNGIGAFLLKNLYLDAANTPTEYDAGVVIDGTQNSSLNMNEITLEQVKVEGTTIPGLKVTSGSSGQIWGLHITDSHFTGTNPNIELDGATDSIFDNLDCVGPRGMTCVHMGNATNQTNSGNEFRHIRSHNGVSKSIGCFIQDDSASGSCSLALPGNYEQTWGLPDTTTGGADVNQNPLSVPLVNVKSSTGFQVNGTPISSANLSDGPSASAASNFSGNLVTGASGSRALSDSGIPASKVVLNTGCGSTQSRCLYLAGTQSATTTSTNPVMLTGSTYTLPANTLLGSGCLDILFSASHTTGTTTSTVSLYVGSQYLTLSPSTSVGHIVLRATYCNTTGTAAGGQILMSESTYASTAGNMSPQFKSFSQASTSALAISLQVADATSTDAWQLETMKVQLEQ